MSAYSEVKQATEPKESAGQIEKLLASKNLLDVANANFGITPQTMRLVRKPNIVPSALAVWLAVPEPFDSWSELFPIRDDSFWKWLKPDDRVYVPFCNSHFLPSSPYPVPAGLEMSRCRDEEQNLVFEYLKIDKSGIIEFADMDVFHELNGVHAFHLRKLAAHTYLFLSFAREIYAEFTGVESFCVFLCMRGTHESQIVTPESAHWRWVARSRCLEPSLRIHRFKVPVRNGQTSVAKIALDFAFDIQSCWGCGRGNKDLGAFRDEELRELRKIAGLETMAQVGVRN